MKFEEKNTIKIEKYNNIFIYFLIKNKEVVYVGQTKNGIFRPLSHYKNKDFDTIHIMYCEEKELDILEDKYIAKYNPKYNKTYNLNINCGLERCKNKLNSYFNNNYNGKKIRIDKMKEIINKLDIKIYSLNNNPYIKMNDYEKLLDYYKKGIKYE